MRFFAIFSTLAIPKGPLISIARLLKFGRGERYGAEPVGHGVRATGPAGPVPLGRRLGCRKDRHRKCGST